MMVKSLHESSPTVLPHSILGFNCHAGRIKWGKRGYSNAESLSRWGGLRREASQLEHWCEAGEVFKGGGKKEAMPNLTKI